MPNYADPLGKAGLISGAGGSALLTQLSDAISWPRRKLWSILGGPEYGQDLPLIRDIESPLLRGILGLGAEVIADPMNIAGGLLGRYAGQKYGGRLENIAKNIGPEFPGDPEEKLARISELLPTSGTAGRYSREHLYALGDNPLLAQIMREVPSPQAIKDFAGQGAEALALHTEVGGVPGITILRRAMTQGDPIPPIPQPSDPLVMPAARSVPFPGIEGGTGYRVNQMAPLEFVGSPNFPEDWHVPVAAAMNRNLAMRGLNLVDYHGGNIARMPTGNYILPDPGGTTIVLKRHPKTLEPIKTAPPPLTLDDLGIPGTALERWALRKWGSPADIQQDIAEGFRRYPEGLSPPVYF